MYISIYLCRYTSLKSFNNNSGHVFIPTSNPLSEPEHWHFLFRRRSSLCEPMALLAAYLWRGEEQIFLHILKIFLHILKKI